MTARPVLIGVLASLPGIVALWPLIWPRPILEQQWIAGPTFGESWGMKPGDPWEDVHPCTWISWDRRQRRWVVPPTWTIPAYFDAPTIVRRRLPFRAPVLRFHPRMI